MKTQRTLLTKQGFTLIELMVAMSITTIIVTVLVYITAIATDVWNRSRAELRASRQAKVMIDSMARDFETLVIRRGNDSEWLSAVSSEEQLGDKVQSTNASNLIFFTGSSDRYDGDIGVEGKDLGGDVSCVAYKLRYDDPIDKNGIIHKTFVLNRLLIDPKETFDELLGKPDLVEAFRQNETELESQNQFICENVFQFTITFMIECNNVVSPSSSRIVTVPVSLSSNAGGTGVTQSLKINKNGIDTQVSPPSSVTADEVKAGRITSIEVSITVVADSVVDQLRTRTFTEAQKAELLARNSFNYAKRIRVPGM